VRARKGKKRVKKVPWGSIRKNGGSLKDGPLAGEDGIAPEKKKGKELKPLLGDSALARA